MLKAVTSLKMGNDAHLTKIYLTINYWVQNSMMPYVYYEMEATLDQKKKGAMFHPLNSRPHAN